MRKILRDYASRICVEIPLSAPDSATLGSGVGGRVGGGRYAGGTARAGSLIPVIAQIPSYPKTGWVKRRTARHGIKSPRTHPPPPTSRYHFRFRNTPPNRRIIRKHLAKDGAKIKERGNQVSPHIRTLIPEVSHITEGARSPYIAWFKI